MGKNVTVDIENTFKDGLKTILRKQNFAMLGGTAEEVSGIRKGLSDRKSEENLRR